MQKLILTSVIVATLVTAALAARDPNARRGMKRLLVLLLAFNVVYLLLLLLVYAPHYVPENW